MENNSVNNSTDNSTAIIAYLTFIGLIIAFVLNNDKKSPFASYHIRQSLGLVVTALALQVILIIPILGWLVSILGFILLIILWIIGLMNAINKKMVPVPILGKKFEEWFRNIQ